MTIGVGRMGSAETASWPQLPLTFATLMSALRSNNLDAARQAYSDLQTSLQPHLGTLIAPVGTALGQGETAQAGKLLGQMRGVIAAAAALPTPAAAMLQVDRVSPAASAASAAFGRLV